MKNLPEKFKLQMKELLKDEYEEFILTYEEKRASGMRANTKKITREDLKDLLLFETNEISWCKDGLYFEEEEKPGKDVFYNAGLYYIQEPSAMSPVEEMEIVEGMKVLDLCSAPGGKSVQICSKIKDNGLLVTNDISDKRIKAVLKNIELQGIKNAVVVNDKPERLYQYFGEYFDRILLDVPCSGEGMFRKDESLINSYEDSAVKTIELQREILEYGAKMLVPGGILVYSTCTFNKDENENQILEFLDKNKDFELVNIEKRNGYVEGYGIKEAARLFPHKLKGEGHFICKLKKLGDNPMNFSIKQNKKPEAYSAFEKENLNIDLQGNFVEKDGRIFLEALETKGKVNLKLIRNGLYLGDVKNNKFTPAQSLVMYLAKNDVKNCIDFCRDDINLIKYLKGETIFADTKVNGIVFIAVEGFIVGYGKNNNGTIKNYYNKSWRIISG